ncbi:MATE family efflux transporter [Vibrio sp. SCSIO 43132]|uniref:MATE family efflux transporter n=1 Tax=Vibrio sp. SCSIO 43132 TaxID=2779363 RepID=UPI001CA7B9BD|nr:MATE family efflux transporter [Vibrio sp. SCSIO 43132]UAB72515.1 MATE family efflux transporter [Vibrio sp. SCSIO 43132]
MESPILSKPVRPALVAMAAPAAFGMLMTFMFQLVDTYFVGQLGTQPLAAMSFAYPVYFLVISLFMGTAAGVSAVVGKALGEKNSDKARSIASISILFFLITAIGLGALGLLSADQVFTLLGTPPDTLPLVKEYMIPLFIGMWALVGTLVANAALMAKGVMVSSTIIMAIGGVTNLVFDYLLIFGVGPFPEMYLEGAALATVISWLVILVLMVSLAFKESLFSFRVLFTLIQSLKELKPVFRIGIPAIAAQVLTPFAVAIITRALSAHGEAAVAAYGIVTRIESLVLTGILALSVVMTPFVAQNYGAKKQGRLDKVIAISGRMTVYWGLLFFAIVALASAPILSIFSDQPEVLAFGSSYFYFVGLTFPAYGLALITTSFFNGVEQPLSSLRITLVRSIILTIPLAWIGSYFGVSYVWAGIATANLIAAWYAGRMLNLWLKTQDSALIGHNPLSDYKRDFQVLLGKR